MSLRISGSLGRTEPSLKISPSLPCGNGFFTLMYSAWIPRIKATRFSSDIGRLAIAALPVGARFDGAGVACAKAYEEEISNAMNTGKVLGTMGVLTCYRA